MLHWHWLPSFTGGFIYSTITLLLLIARQQTSNITIHLLFSTAIVFYKLLKYYFQFCMTNTFLFAYPLGRFAAPTIDVLLSPKDTHIKEHEGAFLVCEFRSSTKIKVWWEKHGDLIPDELTRLVSTTQWKYNSYFVVIHSLTIIL